MPDALLDIHGNERRCGTIPRAPKIAVGGAYEDIATEWPESQVRASLQGNRESRIELMREAGFLSTFTKKANQFQSSACNGWLVANAYTLARWFGGQQDGKVFSGAYPYSWMNNGRDAGSVLEDGYRVGYERGNVTVEECPWNLIYRQHTSRFDASAAHNKSTAPYPARTRLGLLTGLARGYIAGVAIHVGRNLEQPDMNGVAGVDNGPGNHAVVVLQMVLLPDGRLGFWTYLDWGPAHGRDGFVLLTWDHFAQTINNHLFWLMPIGQNGDGE